MSADRWALGGISSASYELCDHQCLETARAAEHASPHPAAHPGQTQPASHAALHCRYNPRRKPGLAGSCHWTCKRNTAILQPMVDSRAIITRPRGVSAGQRGPDPRQSRRHHAEIRAAMLSGRFEAEGSSQIPLIVRPGIGCSRSGRGSVHLDAAFAPAPGRQRARGRGQSAPAAYMERLHARNQARKVRRPNAVLTNEAVPSKTLHLRQISGWAR